MVTESISLTRATNAYDLLTEIIQLALEEPKRINMDFVLAVGEAITRRGMIVPRCGTVGCVAGWTLVKTGKLSKNNAYFDMDIAAGILGLSFDQRRELFLPTNLMSASKHKKQTRVYAREVVKHIKAFQAKYKNQLLGWRI